MASERVITSIPVDFETADVSGEGVIQNLGRGGLFVGSRVIPSEGEPVSLRFELLGDGEIELEATVWWTTDTGPRERSANPGFGLRVAAPNAAYDEAVDKLLG
jgi:hypothetical protein